MRFAGRTSNEHVGEIDLLECEHCGYEQSQARDAKPIKDVPCRKCGKKSPS